MRDHHHSACLDHYQNSSLPRSHEAASAADRPLCIVLGNALTRHNLTLATEDCHIQEALQMPLSMRSDSNTYSYLWLIKLFKRLRRSLHCQLLLLMRLFGFAQNIGVSSWHCYQDIGTKTSAFRSALDITHLNPR